MTQTPPGWQKRTYLFFISQCITLFGSQISQMAIVWHVTLDTNRGVWVAAFSLCAYLPQFLLSFAGGIWADRYDRKRLILFSDAFIAAVTLLTMLILPCIKDGAAFLSLLLMMCIARAAGSGVQSPAVSAVIPSLVPEAQRMRYNGINAAMQSAVQFAAPAAAALILSTGSLSAALAADVLTAAAGMALLSRIRLPKEKNVQLTPSFLADLGRGTRYAFAERPVRSLLIFYSLFVFFTVPAGYLSVLLVRRVYGDTYWHLTAVELSGFGGMTVGGVIMSLLGGFKGHRTMLSVALAMFGAMAACMGLIPAFPVYLLLMFLFGVALTAVQTTITTMLQRYTVSAMQGRVFGLMSALYAICYPVGMALFGSLADRFSLSGIMIFSGASLLLSAFAAFLSPFLKGSDLP